MKKWEIVNKRTGDIVARVEAEQCVSNNSTVYPAIVFVGDNEAQLQFVGNANYYEVRSAD
jgi:hypothetical protein